MPTALELAYQPNLKIERAVHHIADLRTKIDAFLSDRPFKMVATAKRKAGWLEFSTEAEKAIPDCFSLIVGDAVHNLAAALDLTIYQMTYRHPRASEWEIAFPFPRRKDGLDSSINKGQVIFAGNKVVEAIKRLEPYPGGHPILNGLHRLDARDKHRLLILSQSITALTGDQLGHLIKKLTGKGMSGPGSLIWSCPEKTPFLTIPVDFVTKHMADSKSETAIQPTYHVAFGQGQPFSSIPVLSKLDEIANTIQEIVASLIEAHLSPENVIPS